MKNLYRITLLLILIFAACKTEKKNTAVKSSEKDYKFIGNELAVGEAISSDEMLAKYKDLKVGDSIKVKFASTIKEVCSKKGCWMKLPLNETEETMVRFKDYSFFMPLDSKGKEVIINGVAFVKETSVKELRHYAEDAGKSAEEIAQITEPKTEFSFEANGVLLK